MGQRPVHIYIGTDLTEQLKIVARVRKSDQCACTNHPGTVHPSILETIGP